MHVSVKARMFLFLLVFMGTSKAYANCISPFLTPTECDFKNEDTHLAFLQSGWYFSKNDKVEELITQGESFIENYYSSVKTTGDFATRWMIAPTVASMATIEIQETINQGFFLANDPWSLKPIYTDILCEIYWTVVEQFSGIDRDCPTTAELLSDFQQIQELDRVRREIQNIIANPDLVLGEEWADAIQEVESVRARLDSLDTFGRNIALPDMGAFYDERYPALAALIAAPNETLQQFRARVGELNTSRRNTIQDHMMATQQNQINLRTSDQQELERLSDMSSRAVGRMQGTEIDNMIGSQKVQNWMTMSEEIMNTTTMYMQDQADSHGDATRKRAVTIKSAEPIPFHEVVLGNGQGFSY